jgi:predicted ATP-grasp superfamily ATP-dependent carboligase
MSADALVLDGIGRQALVTTRALGRLGLRVTTAESSDMCRPRFDRGSSATAGLRGLPTFASRWSQREDILPSYHVDPTAYAQALLDLVRAYPTRVVIPSTDGSIAALRPWRSCFEEQAAPLALASEAALDVANDKQRTLAEAAELGIPYPRSVPIDRFEDTEAALAEVGYPAVIKPTQSWVSKTDLAARVISKTVLDLPEALAYVEQLNDVGSSSAVVQQLVGGSREAVSVFYAQGKVWASFAQVAHRTTPALGGTSVVRESISMPVELESAALALVRALDLEGYSEVEFRRDARGRPLLMEINARLSGSLEVAVRSGIPFPALLWQWASGEPLSPVLGYRTGIKMRYLKGDIIWLRENIESRGRRPDCVPPRKAITIFARDFLRRQTYDYMDRGDIGPALVALAENVGIAQRSLAKGLPPTPHGHPHAMVTWYSPSCPPARPQGSTTLFSTEVAVIGAGPNGLSVGAHLRHAGVEHRVFGRTMGAWRFNMPAGMMLKSEPYASDLSAPGPGFLARDYCHQAEDVYHERVIPLSREQFVAYGSWFASQLVPEVEETEVTSLSQLPTGGFRLLTANGEHIRAARVVVATGIMPFAFVPPELSGFPPDLVSHTSEHADLAAFRGKDVLVVGGGSSALETAALLLEQGAAVKLVIRGDGVKWPRANLAHPTRLQRFQRPVARLCEGWSCWGCDRFPDLFRLLPKEIRADKGLSFLGPAGAWWLRDRVEGRVPMLLGHQVLGAERVGDRVRLHLSTSEGVVTECADHVIVGTGFRLDLSRLAYVTPSLRGDLKLFAGAPVLDHHLESNVPGLFFTGALAAPSLGPVMRFIAGTHFTGPRLVNRILVSGRHGQRSEECVKETRVGYATA